MKDKSNMDNQECKDTDRILYSRDRDGNVPVLVKPDGYEIQYPNKKIVCSSARSLISTLTGHPTGWNWTFDRYFRLGRFDPSRNLGPTFMRSIIDLINDIASQESSNRSFNINKSLGIDLEKRGDEVAKLLFSGFKGWIFGCGYDPEDVLQEVYKGILIRNMGKCPFDERKASFGHYVHQVCRCILSNYHRRESRKVQSEVIGVKTYQEGKWERRDVAEVLSDTCVYESQNSNTVRKDLAMAMRAKPTKDHRLALKVVPLLGMGYTHADMAMMLDLSKSSISKAMVTIRKVARDCGYRSLK